MAADTTLNLTTTLGTNPTAFWDIQNRTPSWLFLMEVATGDTPTAEEVALGYALQANEHRTGGLQDRPASVGAGADRRLPSGG